MVAVPTFGKYRPLAELGRGGMATVFLAAHAGPGGFTKLVVVKELRPELSGELEFRQMFLDEARLAARLNHPNIVQTYEVTEDDGRQLIVMEYLEGQPFSNVRTRLGRDGTLSLADHVRVISDMLDGLHAAHELRDWSGAPLEVVHRDVSPHNVFVTYEGVVKVVDFGIAKAAISSRHTRTGVIKGKISYMAPEQALGGKVDRRADVFAAGIMLWEAVAIRRMWKDLPDVGILHRLGTGELPRVRDFVADPDPLLEKACERALAPSPDARYATAAEMRAELEAFLAKFPPRPDPHRFGVEVAIAFAKEREEIRRVLGEQLRNEQPGGAPLPAISETAEGSHAGASATSSLALTSVDRPPREPMTASGALAVETAPRIPATAPRTGRRRGPVAVALGALAAMLVAGGWFALGSRGGPGTAAIGPGGASGAAPHACVTRGADPSSRVEAGLGTAGSASPRTSAQPAAGSTPKPTAKPTTRPPLDIELRR